MTNPTPRRRMGAVTKPIECAKQTAGGTAALARKLGISKQAVSMWEKIPAERVIAIEAATGIPREELRPDLYPARPRLTC